MDVLYCCCLGRCQHVCQRLNQSTSLLHIRKSFCKHEFVVLHDLVAECRACGALMQSGASVIFEGNSGSHTLLQVQRRRNELKSLYLVWLFIFLKMFLVLFRPSSVQLTENVLHTLWVALYTFFFKQINKMYTIKNKNHILHWLYIGVWVPLLWQLDLLLLELMHPLGLALELLARQTLS